MRSRNPRPFRASGSRQAEGEEDVNKVRVLVALLSVLFFCSNFANAAGKEWEYYSTVNSVDKGDISLFFFPDSIEKTKSGNVRVWTKGIFTKDFVSKEKNLLTEPKTRDMIGKRIGTKYVPPALSDEPYDRDLIISITMMEVAATYSNFTPAYKLYFEFGCDGKQIKQLSIVSTDGSHNEIPLPVTGDWVYIPPDSASSTLVKLACRHLHS